MSGKIDLERTNMKFMIFHRLQKYTVWQNIKSCISEHTWEGEIMVIKTTEKSYCGSFYPPEQVQIIYESWRETYFINRFKTYQTGIKWSIDKCEKVLGTRNSAPPTEGCNRKALRAQRWFCRPAGRLMELDS